MIKRYNQFVNESKQVPGPGTEGSVRINISDEESDMFATEPSLEKLISDNKVALLAPELWYMEDDTETIGILKNYFDIETDEEDYDENTGRGYDLNGDEPGFDEENESVKVNEDLETNDGSIANHESLICPYCKCEQAEHPENIFEDDFAEWDCDDCGKKFDCSRVVEVTYYTKKIKGIE